MKKLLLLAIVLLAATTLSAQDKYDTFIEKMEVENNVKNFVNNYIDTLAKESSAITTSKWTDIKEKINYANYLKDVEKIIRANYSIAEIDKIFAENDMISPINDTNKFIYKPKEIVTAKMYELNRAFGRALNAQIKTLILQ